MTHTDALRLQAAEKYVLNELTEAERQEYEDHYFDCPACTEELKATVAFVDSSRQLFREGAFEPEPVPVRTSVPTPRRGGWLSWLQPAFAIPVFAALLLFIVYQNGVTIPRLKQGAANTATANVAKYVELLAAGARGNGAHVPTISVGKNEKFSLHVDMPGNSEDGYLCQIQDQSGRVRQTIRVSSEEAKRFVQVDVPGGTLEPGTYNFVTFKGEASTPTANTSAASQQSFAVEIDQ
jgi:hypothetical protein